MIFPARLFRIAAASPVKKAVNMASAVLGRLLRLSAVRNGPLSPPSPSTVPGRTVTPSRTAVCTSSGALLPKPKKTPFGLIRIALVVVPFLYVGTQISKSFAALLEEHDIFVPEDDDDDD
ncbi:essential MCU regulator, mitochondrial [Xiphophorus maculatus]|nr:essential MCU regulator, mitochondrial [Xiphophorus maculatus]XP_032444363.1 essential MCU regulator, mitochondrial [Xiphophorus hellerii]